MDRLKFSQLISYITMLTNHNHTVLHSQHIEYIDQLVKPTPMFDNKVPFDKVDLLLSLMQEKTKKIEAIKAYRDLTGAGLKEAKDAVEKYL